MNVGIWHLTHCTRWHTSRHTSRCITGISSDCSSSFSHLSRQHKEEVPEDIFDMLLSFTDFLTFKEMFLDYRAVSGHLDPTYWVTIDQHCWTSNKSVFQYAQDLWFDGANIVYYSLLK